MHRLGRAVRGLLLVGSLLGGSAIASAGEDSEIYRWVDEQGHVHFSETPPAHSPAGQWQGPERSRLQILPPSERSRPATRQLRELERARTRSLAIEPQTGGTRRRAGQDPCRTARAHLQSIERAEAEVSRIEAQIEAKENDPVMRSSSRCTRTASSDCRHFSYDREDALEKLARELEKARDKLERAEAARRHAGFVPQGCPGT